MGTEDFEYLYGVTYFGVMGLGLLIFFVDIFI